MLKKMHANTVYHCQILCLSLTAGFPHFNSFCMELWICIKSSNISYKTVLLQMWHKTVERWINSIFVFIRVPLIGVQIFIGTFHVNLPLIHTAFTSIHIKHCARELWNVHKHFLLVTLRDRYVHTVHQELQHEILDVASILASNSVYESYSSYQ